jgi:hypothetical protein
MREDDGIDLFGGDPKFIKVVPKCLFLSSCVKQDAFGQAVDKTGKPPVWDKPLLEGLIVVDCRDGDQGLSL